MIFLNHFVPLPPEGKGSRLREAPASVGVGRSLKAEPNRSFLRFENLFQGLVSLSASRPVTREIKHHTPSASHGEDLDLSNGGQLGGGIDRILVEMATKGFVESAKHTVDPSVGVSPQPLDRLDHKLFFCHGFVGFKDHLDDLFCGWSFWGFPG